MNEELIFLAQQALFLVLKGGAIIVGAALVGGVSAGVLQSLTQVFDLSIGFACRLGALVAAGFSGGGIIIWWVIQLTRELWFG